MLEEDINIGDNDQGEPHIMLSSDELVQSLGNFEEDLFVDDQFPDLFHELWSINDHHLQP